MRVIVVDRLTFPVVLDDRTGSLLFRRLQFVVILIPYPATRANFPAIQDGC